MIRVMNANQSIATLWLIVSVEQKQINPSGVWKNAVKKGLMVRL